MKSCHNRTEQKFLSRGREHEDNTSVNFVVVLKLSFSLCENIFSFHNFFFLFKILKF